MTREWQPNYQSTIWPFCSQSSLPWAFPGPPWPTSGHRRPCERHARRSLEQVSCHPGPQTMAKVSSRTSTPQGGEVMRHKMRRNIKTKWEDIIRRTCRRVIICLLAVPFFFGSCFRCGEVWEATPADWSRMPLRCLRHLRLGCPERRRIKMCLAAKTHLDQVSNLRSLPFQMAGHRWHLEFPVVCFGPFPGLAH